jgi:hypothetical protein
MEAKKLLSDIQNLLTDAQEALAEDHPLQDKIQNIKLYAFGKLDPLGFKALVEDLKNEML